MPYFLCKKIFSGFLFLSIIFSFVLLNFQDVSATNINRVSREQLTEKFNATKMGNKYKLRGSALQKIVKSDNREKTEVRIGNENSSSFEPIFEFRKWDEVSIKLTPQLSSVDQVDKNLELVGNKIKYKTPKDEVNFYELPESSALPEGGYEIERILNEKPLSNVISFDLQADNVEFFYQPIYSDEEIAVQTEQGNFINLDAMGSYAIYYKNVPDNYTNGKLYRTGKLGQIMRPRIDDAVGNWTWGELHVDTVNNSLTITIPQDFLDNATYPIYHASGLIFGYQTIGTGGVVTILNAIKCTLNTMGATAGVVDTMTIYSDPSTVANTMNSGIYLHSTLGFVTNATGPTLTPVATGAAWRTITYTSKPSLSGDTDYLLCANGFSSSGTHVVYYDIGAANMSHAKASTFPTYPDPMVSPTHSSRLFSIYATYTVVPGAPTNVAATDGSATDKVTVTWTKSTDATGYRIYRDSSDVSGLLGDVATYDDTGATAGTITAGTASATDGSATDRVTLGISGESANNGTTHTYYVVAVNTAGTSANSSSDTGYRGVGALTYVWKVSAADSDASYSTISGATTDPYDYTSASAATITAGTAAATDGSANDKVTLSVSGETTNTVGRYYYATLSATGAASVDTNHDRGYRGVGSITYQWYRSSGTGDSDYSSLGAGATTDPYDDTSAPAGTITPGATSASDGTVSSYVVLSLSGQSVAVGAVRYYFATLSATGASSVDTTHNDGYRGVGSLTYQWQRSASDSDASYSNIDGATTASYNDTGAPGDGSGRYFQCVESADGAASSQSSTADRGYRGVISITVTANGTINYGLLEAGGNKSSIQLGTTPVVQNSGTVAEDFYIQGANTACPWTLSDTAGNGTYKHEYSSNGGSNWTALTTVGEQVLVSNIAASATQNLDLRITVPTVSSCYTQQNAGIVITAFEH